MSDELPPSSHLHLPELQGNMTTVLPGASHTAYPPNVDSNARIKEVSSDLHQNRDAHGHAGNESVPTSLSTHNNRPENSPCQPVAQPLTAPRKSRWGSRVATIDPTQSSTSSVPTASHVSLPGIPVQASLEHQVATGYPGTTPLPLVSSTSEGNAPVPNSKAILEDRRSHAIQIARKFNQEAQQLRNIQGNNRFVYDGVSHDQYQIITAPGDASLGRNYTDTLAVEYATKRNAFWERFDTRKRKATMKNLEFVAQRQVERAKQRIAQLEETRIQEREIASYHDAMFKSRSNVAKSLRMSSVAGLGTQERNAHEQKRKQVISKAIDNALAIYVAGLSTGETSSSKSTEETMRALFGCYGEIRKIHFYVEKQTGKRKGDALVIYNVSANNDDTRRSLVEMVCSQLNGAELPDGSRLQVEASDPMYKLRKQKPPCSDSIESIGEKNPVTESLSTVQTTVNEAIVNEGGVVNAQDPTPTDENTGEGGGDDGDDLDDFFSSLA